MSDKREHPDWRIGEQLAPATDHDLQRAGIGELEPLDHVNFSPGDVLQALNVLALEGGNGKRAEKILAEQGLRVDHATLYRWRNERFANRYRAVCLELAPRIEQAVVDAQRELALRAARAAHNAVELEDDRLAAGEVKDAAASARNLATVSGISVDKVMSMTNRPTQIVEHRTADQALKRLEQLARTVEGTAVEIGGEEGGGGVDA